MSSCCSCCEDVGGYWMPKAWWWFWVSELPITLCSVLVWVADAPQYLHGLSDSHSVGSLTHMEYILLLGWGINAFWSVFLVQGVFLYKINPYTWQERGVPCDYMREAYIIFLGGVFVGKCLMLFAFLPYNWVQMDPNYYFFCATCIAAATYMLGKLLFFILQYRAGAAVDSTASPEVKEVAVAQAV
eukprot:gnl/Spiro4/27245_TR13547_c0_g1_i1.p1 gnl/Spiro4/27245_TR13547_c0_g1~~gnl/Spiro4/27245_TR13547_c0_g1_i1.p1  ORF type:complete len:186 (+),score=46.58 gnl/Spiro4/27245_TR13547_c0_g1_i1:42-599(+)